LRSQWAVRAREAQHRAPEQKYSRRMRSDVQGVLLLDPPGKRAPKFHGIG
jgi:hypothetical protein